MNIINWIITSSADPNKTSLTLKSIGLGLIPYVLQIASLTCGLHIVCLAIDGNVLMSVVETVANLLYLILSVVAGVGFLWGLLRKIYLARWSAAPLT